MGLITFLLLMFVRLSFEKSNSPQRYNFFARYANFRDRNMVPSLVCKINLSKNKIRTQNQANTCIFEKFVVPLQHDFDYEEFLSQHHTGGGILSY